MILKRQKLHGIKSTYAIQNIYNIYLYLLQGGTNPISMLGVNTHFLNLAITLVLQISSEIADILRFN